MKVSFNVFSKKSGSKKISKMDEKDIKDIVNGAIAPLTQEIQKFNGKVEAIENFASNTDKMAKVAGIGIGVATLIIGVGVWSGNVATSVCNAGYKRALKKARNVNSQFQRKEVEIE